MNDRDLAHATTQLANDRDETKPGDDVRLDDVATPPADTDPRDDGGSDSKGSVQAQDAGSNEGTDGDPFDALLKAVASAPHEHRPVHMPAPGDTLGDDVEIIRELGSGGMGRVFLGRDLKLGRRVAVKVVRPRGDADRRERLRQLFENEARATARLNHPNIVTVHQLGEFEALPFLVMELLRGQTLAERLEETQPGAGLPVDSVLRIGAEIADALACAHAERIAHRDLKPSNVFLTDDGRTKILDFGLAALVEASAGADPEDLTESRQGLRGISSCERAGTPRYMAPEQWQGESVSAAVDVWALGLIMLEMLSGTLEWSARRAVGDTPPPVDATRAPEALQALLCKLLEPQPEARPTAREVADTLREIDARRRTRAAPDVDGDAMPFRYLEAFGTADADWFFGRDADIARLRARLRARPMVVVTAPSGAGKSSLLHAGLAPRLTRESPPRKVLTLRLDPGVLQRCADTLRTSFGATDCTPEALREAPGRFGQALRELTERESCHVLVVVDALEQILLLDPADRQVVARMLQSAADDVESPVRVVAAVRDDYLARLELPEELSRLVADGIMPLAAPDEEALAEAVRGPIRRTGYTIAPQLVDRLVDALADEPVPLPLLQLAASRIWEQRDVDEKHIPADALERLGGLSGLLAEHAESVFDALPDDEMREHARTVMCLLVGPDGRRVVKARDALIDAAAGHADDGRPESDTRTTVDETIDRLVRGRLLSLTRAVSGASGPQLEIVHDAIVDHWTRLQHWLDASRAERRFRDRLEHAAADWVDHDEPPELLWRGPTLADARDWRGDVDASLSGDARRFLDASIARTRRRARLRRIAMVVVLVVLATLAVGSWIGMEYFRAERTRADEARAQSDALVAYMLDDLHDRLSTVGRLDLLEDVLQRAERYYRDADAPERALRHALALRHLGDVARARGELTVAMDRYDDVSERLDPIVDELPAASQALAATHVARAQVLRAQGQLDDARAAAELGLKRYEALLAAQPDDTELRLDIARGLLELGDVRLDTGDVDAARTAYMRSLELSGGAGQPETAPGAYDAARALLRMGDIARVRGERKRAQAAYGRATTMIEKSGPDQGSDAVAQDIRAAIATSLGRLAASSGRHEEALSHFETARDLLDRLVRFEPQHAGWRARLAGAWLDISSSRRTADDVQAAAKAAQKALNLVEVVPEGSGRTLVEWQNALAAVHIELGAIAEAAGRTRDALSAYRLALDIRHRLHALDPHNARWQAARAEGFSLVAEVLAKLGRRSGALEALESANRLLTDLVQTDPDHVVWRQQLAAVARQLGDLHAGSGELDQAADAYAKARANTSFAAQRMPTAPRARRQLALDAIRLGDTEMSRDDIDAALRAFDEALDAFRALSKLAPESARARRDVAMMLAKRGDALRGAGREKQAAADFEAALDAMHEAVALAPRNVRLTRDLSVAWDRVGDMRRKLGDTEGATRALQESARIARELAARDPANTQWQRDLSVSLDKLGDLHLDRGEPELALARYTASLAIAQKLVALDARNIAWQRDLALVHERIGRAHEAAGRIEAARRAYAVALELLSKLVARAPQASSVADDLARVEGRLPALREATAER